MKKSIILLLLAFTVVAKAEQIPSELTQFIPEGVEKAYFKGKTPGNKTCVVGIDIWMNTFNTFVAVTEIGSLNFQIGFGHSLENLLTHNDQITAISKFTPNDQYSGSSRTTLKIETQKSPQLIFTVITSKGLIFKTKKSLTCIIKDKYMDAF